MPARSPQRLVQQLSRPTNSLNLVWKDKGAGFRDPVTFDGIAIQTKFFLLIRDTPLGKSYVLGTFLTREVTDMGFKVASRVRGLSDEAFREAFGAEEQCRSALSRLRWPDGFVCPACGHRGHCVLAGRRPLPMHPVQEADILHGGHDLPRHQAAADAVVRGRPPDRNGEERDFPRSSWGAVSGSSSRPPGP